MANKITPEDAHETMSNAMEKHLADNDRAHPGGNGAVDHGPVSDNYSVIHYHNKKGWNTHSSGHSSMDVADTKARPLVDKYSKNGERSIEYGMSRGGGGGATKDYDVKDSAERSLASVRVMKTLDAHKFLDRMDRNYPGIVKSRPKEFK